MIHALLYLLFILPFTAWLGYELKRPYSFRDNWPVLAIAVILGLLASMLSIHFGGIVGNYLLHGIGGGLASSVLFLYVLKTLKLHFSWRLELMLLFAFTSSLGVLNELAEYAVEFLHLGIFSWDTHDTWRDLLANTVGSLIGWTIICLLIHYRNTGKSGKKQV